MIAKAGKRSFSNYKSAALPTELCRQKRTAKFTLQHRREQVVDLIREYANTRRAVPPFPNS